MPSNLVMSDRRVPRRRGLGTVDLRVRCLLDPARHDRPASRCVVGACVKEHGDARRRSQTTRDRREPAGRDSDRERRIELLIRRLPARFQPHGALAAPTVRALGADRRRDAAHAGRRVQYPAGPRPVDAAARPGAAGRGCQAAATLDRPHPGLDRAPPAALDGTVATCAGARSMEWLANPDIWASFVTLAVLESRPRHRQPGVHRPAGRPSARRNNGHGRAVSACRWRWGRDLPCSVDRLAGPPDRSGLRRWPDTTSRGAT